MRSITINLPEHKVAKLEDKAKNLGLTVEALLHINIDELLKEPDSEVMDIINEIIDKNSELYRRLA